MSPLAQNKPATSQRGWPTLSFPLRVLLLFLVIAVGMTVAQATFGRRATLGLLTQNAHQSLHAAAQQTALRLDIFVEGSLAAVKREASLPVVIEYIDGDDAKREALASVVIQLLRSLLAQDPVFAKSAAIWDIDGNTVFTVAPNPSEQPATQMPGLEQFFHTMMDTGTPQVSDLLFDDTGEALIHFAAPVWVSDTLIGALRVSYDARVLQRQLVLDSGRLGPATFPVLFDENQLCIAHGGAAPSADSPWQHHFIRPLPAAMLNQLRKAGRLPPPRHDSDADSPLPPRPQLAAALSGENGPTVGFTTRSLLVSDREMAASTASMENKPWQVAFMQPTDALLTPAAQVESDLLTQNIIMITGALLVALVLVRRLTRPIIELTRVTQAFGTGALEARAQIKRHDEIGSLGIAFNGMAETIQSRVESQALIAATSRQIINANNEKLDETLKALPVTLAEFFRATRVSIIGFSEKARPTAYFIHETTPTHRVHNCGNGRDNSGTINVICSHGSDDTLVCAHGSDNTRVRSSAGNGGDTPARSDKAEACASPAFPELQDLDWLSSHFEHTDLVHLVRLERPLWRQNGTKELMAAPFLQSNKVIGMLCLSSTAEISPWRQDDEQVLSLLAEMISRAMQRKENAQRIKALNESLEQRVVARTTELQTANRRLKHEIEERIQLQAERDAINDQLYDVARQAGMAEVATTVLHNVGNALNSVGVTAFLLDETIRASPHSRVRSVAELFGTNEADLVTFITTGKGAMLPRYLEELSQKLEEQHTKMLSELGDLRASLEHANEIVTAQQSVAVHVDSTEMRAPASLMEDAHRICSQSLQRCSIAIERDYQQVPEIPVMRNKVLQILVNLLNNAKDAMLDSSVSERRLTLRVQRHRLDDLDSNELPAGGLDVVHEQQQGLLTVIGLHVTDSGVGIRPEDRVELFRYGFTTKPNGHGFGLHGSALAAREMRGWMAVHSSGLGDGSRFTLYLPCPSGHASIAHRLPTNTDGASLTQRQTSHPKTIN